MAGRYVVIEFDDKELARAFAEDPDLPEDMGFKVRAAYLKPKSYCTCPGVRNVKDWRKHRIYGLYICVTCKKPSKHHQSGIVERLRYVFGNNILGL